LRNFGIEHSKIKSPSKKFLNFPQLRVWKLFSERINIETFRSWALKNSLLKKNFFRTQGVNSGMRKFKLDVKGWEKVIWVILRRVTKIYLKFLLGIWWWLWFKRRWWFVDNGWEQSFEEEREWVWSVGNEVGR